MPLLKRDRPRAIGHLFNRIQMRSDKERKELKAAAKEAQAGNERPLIDLLKKIVNDPEMLAALLKLLPLILPLLLLL